MRYLLDKNIVRYILSALTYGERRPLSQLEFTALSFWKFAEDREAHLYISGTTFHVLQQMRDNAFVNLVLDTMPALYPTRYHARWSRRVRTITGHSREDAFMIGLATFGTNSAGTILGVNALVSADQPMINGYAQHHVTLQSRFQKMVVQLSPPFDAAQLPQLIRPSSS